MANERKGKKLRRCTAKSKAYYAVQIGKTESNMKRKLAKHLRDFPEDAQAAIRYEKTFGRVPQLK